MAITSKPAPIVRPGVTRERLSFAALAFAILWLSASLSRFGYKADGVRLRLGELIGIAVLAGIALGVARAGRLNVRWAALLLPLVYIGSETMSTLLNRADWGRGFKLDILLGVEAALAIGVAYVASAVDPRALARIIVGAGTLTAAAAVILTILYVLHLTTFGVQTDPVVGICKTYGTMWEANILASYLGGVLVFSLAVRQFLNPPWVRFASWGVLALAIGLAWTRAVWIAALVGVATLLLLEVAKSRRIPKIYLPAGVGIAGLVALASVALVEAAQHGLCGSLQISPISTEGSIHGRFQIISLALQEWTRSPWWGLGTGSFRSHLPGDPNQPWIWSMAATALHDTGVIGSILLAGLIGWLIWALIRWAAAAPDPDRSVTRGLAAAIITILAAFQATTGMLMEFPWIFAGTAIGILQARRRA